MKTYVIIIALLLTAAFLQSCADSSTGNDVLDPKITVYSPASNDTITTGEREVIYDAFDDQGIKFIELYVNGALFETFTSDDGKRPEVTLNVDSALIDSRLRFYLKIVDLANNSAVSDSMINILVVGSDDITAVPATPPFNLTVQRFANQPTIVNISWTDTSKNVQRYELWRSVGSPDSSNFFLQKELAANTSNTNDELPDTNQIYFYKMRTINMVDSQLYTSDFSEIINSFGGQGGGTIIPPSNLNADARGTQRVILTWQDNSDDENYFLIQRRLTSSSNFDNIAITAPNTEEYVDESSGLFGGGQFTYRVKVFNQSDSAASSETSVTMWLFDLDPPSDLQAAVIDTPQYQQKAVRLTWTDNSNQETQYLIERKTGLQGTYLQIASLSADITQYDDAQITDGATYVYRIRAGRENKRSDYSNEVSIDVP
jgi:hypothetical protein